MPKFLSDGIFDGLSTDLTVDGKVGIGIALNSSYVLNVGGSINTQGNLVIKTRPVLQFSSGTFQLGDVSSQNFPTVIHSNNNVETIRVTGGKVGIAATNPSELLQVGDGSAGAVSIKVYGSSAGSNLWLNTPTNATSINYIGFGDSLYATQNTRGRIAYQSNVSPQGNYMAFTVNRGEIMRLTNSDVGINEDNPSQRLHVDGNVRITGAIYDSNNSPGTSGQVLSSTATGTDWIDQGDVVAGEADKAKSVILRVKNSTASAMSKGQVVCEAVSATPPSGNLIEVALADNNGTNTMPALGILNEDLDAAGGANDEGDAIMFGKVSGIDTSAFSVGDEVFVDDTPGGLTTTKPTGVKYIQKVGVVIRDDATNGTIEVFGAGRVNDVPTPLYVDHTGQKLGIGEQTPASLLHIKENNTSVSSGLTIEQSGTGDAITQYLLTGARRWVVGADNSDSDKFKIASSTNLATDARLTIDSSGNVGIGTTSPSVKLNIEGTGGEILRLKDTDGTFTSMTLYNGATNSDSRNWGIFTNGYFYGDFNIVSSTTNTGDPDIINATRLTINKDGNVGIGTTSPTAKLEVRNDVAASTDLDPTALKLYNNSDGGSAIEFSNGVAGNAKLSFGVEGTGASTDETYIGFSTSVNGATATERMRITSAGDVGIGTTSPSQKLEVAGNIQATGTRTISAQYDSNNYMRLESNSSGGVLKGLDGGVITTLVRSYGDSYFNGGNVGIGNANPGFKLQVTGDGSFEDRVRVVGVDPSNPAVSANHVHLSGYGLAGNRGGFYITNQDTAGNIQFGIGGVHAANTKMYIKNDGNVGIGNTNPIRKLDVSSSGVIADFISSTTQSLVDITGSSNRLRIGTFSGNVGIAYGTVTSPHLAINSSGNVGIGTTDPYTNFEVVGKGSFGSSGASNLGVEISSVGAIPSAQVKGYIAQATSGAGGGNGDLLIASRTSAATNIRFFAGSTSEKMRINSSGYVGINKTLPGYHLDVDGEARIGSTGRLSTRLLIQAENTAGSPATTTEIRMLGYESRGQGIFFQDSGNSGEEWFAGLNYAGGWDKYSIGYDASGGQAEYVANAILTAVGSTGNVGIGQTNPSTYKLDVTGTIRATGDVIAYSDIRVKENITNIENALDKVKKLRGVEYNKIDNQERSIGVIAQEIEEVIPQVVREDNEGMKSVAYGNITAVLIEAIKEQQKQIDELKNQLDAFTK